MEKYLKPGFEIVELDEDVLTSSLCPEDEPCDDSEGDITTPEIEF